jgi:hypothetical protein
MPVGTCKLCLQTRDLRESDLLPKALYRMSRWDGDPNPNPLHLSARGSVRTSRQIKDYVLCRDCEQRFSRNGERYAMSQVNRNGSFPLLKTLQASPFAKRSGGFAFYDLAMTPSIDRRRLGSFALSFFWRATVHLWHKPEQKLPHDLICLAFFSRAMKRWRTASACGLMSSFPTTFLLQSTAPRRIANHR